MFLSEAVVAKSEKTITECGKYSTLSSFLRVMHGMNVSNLVAKTITHIFAEVTH